MADPIIKIDFSPADRYRVRIPVDEDLRERMTEKGLDPAELDDVCTFFEQHEPDELCEYASNNTWFDRDPGALRVDHASWV